MIDERGQVVLRQTFKTTEGNLLGLLRRVQSPKSLTFEECHLAQWLYVLLKDQVDQLIVCNPVFLGKKPGAKTDDRDALHLAQELRTGHLVPVYHDESHWIELRVLVNGYLGLVEGIVRAKNRLKAVFRSEALETNASDFYETARERAKELSHDHARFVAESLFWQIDGLEKRKTEYREAFKRNIKRYRPVKNLTTIGRSELKEAFVGAAESVLRTDGSLRNYYDELRAKGIPHPEAKRSLARKIAAIALSVLKNNHPFDEIYENRERYRDTLRKKLTEAV